jgi:outer membrane protein TolC
MVSLPIPIHGGRKQGQMVVEARSQLAADEAQHHASVNDVRAIVAGQYADVERARTELALYTKAVLPQANASLHSAAAGYQAGRGDFASVLAAQAAVFEYETTYYRALTDFAKGVAKLERTVGKEILR